MGRYVAVDLGATSGRVAVVDTSDGTFSIDVVHRFPHAVVRTPEGSLTWEWNHLIEETLIGLHKVARLGPVTSVGVDAWAVDYGFIDKEGDLLPPIISYRDSRTAMAFNEITRMVGREQIYKKTGIQFLPLNTLYQLVASKGDLNYSAADKFLLLPDLLNHLLTGSTSTEITNASTTQLLNTRTRSWDFDLVRAAGLRPDVFPALHEPGSSLGNIRGHGDLDGVKVVAVGSHDTASAVAGAPFIDTTTEAFISSGTWSLLGIESPLPFTSSAALEANITNELGVGGTVRVLKNITGLWILEECRRDWLSDGIELEMPELVDLAESASPINSVISPNDPCFTSPGGMPDRVRAYMKQSGQIVVETPGEIARSVFLSLALAYRRALKELEEVTGRSIKTLHILGGGSQIEMLNQFTADATGREIIAGPVEATILGNVMVQAIAAGEFTSLRDARAHLRSKLRRQSYLPRTGINWTDLERRIDPKILQN